MTVTDIGVLYGILWAFFDRLESVSICISTSILQISPSDFVPIDVARLFEVLKLRCVKLLQTVRREPTDPVKRHVAIQSGSFVGTKQRVDGTCECELPCWDEGRGG